MSFASRRRRTASGSEEVRKPRQCACRMRRTRESARRLAGIFPGTERGLRPIRPIQRLRRETNMAGASEWVQGCAIWDESRNPRKGGSRTRTVAAARAGACRARPDLPSQRRPRHRGRSRPKVQSHAGTLPVSRDPYIQPDAPDTPDAEASTNVTKDGDPLGSRSAGERPGSPKAPAGAARESDRVEPGMFARRHRARVGLCMSLRRLGPASTRC